MGANASSTGGAGVSLKASTATTHSGSAKASQVSKKKGKCGTKFGSSMATPDGIISWNDTTGGMDNAGAADVSCKKKTKIKSVSAYGYFGTATETFHVTVYGNSTTNGSNEPNDKALCDYPALTGSAGGQYPTHALTTLKLTKVCKLPKGLSWVSIQNVDSGQPWYWEMTDALGGTTGPDWGDRPDAFGSGCTTYDNDRYLVDCLGYPYADWMLMVK